MTKKILQPGLVRAFRDSSEAVARVKSRRYGAEFMALVALREAAWTALVRSNDRAGYMACRTMRAFQSLPV
jgi:hypothetical protein